MKGHKAIRLLGRVNRLCSALLFLGTSFLSFINLVMGCHILINIKPFSQLKLFECKQISIVSFIKKAVHVASGIAQSVYAVKINFMSRCNMISVTEEFSGWPWYKCLISLMSRLYGSSSVSHIHLAVLKWDAVHTRDLEAQSILDQSYHMEGFLPRHIDCSDFMLGK